MTLNSKQVGYIGFFIALWYIIGNPFYAVGFVAFAWMLGNMKN